MSESNTLQAVRLPDKPSALIRLGLADLRKVEKSSKYKVSMRSWHSPNGVCSVCFAGAVMAGTLRLPRSTRVSSFDDWSKWFDRDTDNKLCAINRLREGHVGSAFALLGRSQIGGNDYEAGHKFDRYIRDYEDDGAGAFHADMEQLAKDLESKGY